MALMRPPTVLLTMLALLLLVMEASAAHNSATHNSNGDNHANRISTTTVSISGGATAALRGKNRLLQVADNKDRKERKGDLFDATRHEKQPFEIVEEEEEPQSIVQEFDADKYRDFVEKANKNTLKGAAKEDKEEKNDKKEKTAAGKDNEQSVPEETAGKIDIVEESVSTSGTAQESIVEANAENEALTEVTEATPSNNDDEEEDPDDDRVQACGIQWDRSISCGGKPGNAPLVCCPGYACEGEWCVQEDGIYTENPAGETTPIKTTDGNLDTETKAVQPEQPFLETMPFDTGSIFNENSSSNSMPSQYQTEIQGKSLGSTVGISFVATISLGGILIAVIALIRLRKQERKFQYRNNLLEYQSDDKVNDHILPLSINAPTKSAKTDSESGESDDNDEDDDISALPLPAFMANYSVNASQDSTGAMGWEIRERGKEITDIAAEDWAKARELDRIVTRISNQNNADYTEDSIWDDSSAPSLNTTTDSVMERFPIPARNTDDSTLEELSVDTSVDTSEAPAAESTNSSWVNFRSCAVWSTNQNDTDDSIWNPSSATTPNSKPAPKLKTSPDSVMDRFPISARDTSDSALEEMSVGTLRALAFQTEPPSPWVKFPSCAVWSYVASDTYKNKILNR